MRVLPILFIAIFARVALSEPKGAVAAALEVVGAQAAEAARKGASEGGRQGGGTAEFTPEQLQKIEALRAAGLSDTEAFGQLIEQGIISPQTFEPAPESDRPGPTASSGSPSASSSVPSLPSDDPQPLIEGGSHGGTIARENNTFDEIETRPAPPAKKAVKAALEQVALPVMSSLDTARQAIEEEVKKGNLPAEAVGPLLAKIAPMVEQFANRLTDAGDDQKKIRDILKEAPRFNLEYDRGATSTQVIAQVVNGMKDAAAGDTAPSAPAATSATSATTGGSATGQTVPQGYNQPAPAVVVVQQPAAGSPATILTVTKKPAGEMAWNPRVGDDPVKGAPSRRPIAEVSAGSAASDAAAKAGIGTGMGGNASGGTLTLSGKVSKSKELLTAWVRGLVERMREPKDEEERVPASAGEKMADGGFSVLKTPKLSATAAIMKFPEAAWDSTAVAMQGLADTWEVPAWARFLVLLSGAALVMLTSWLIWRRRFSPRA